MNTVHNKIIVWSIDDFNSLGLMRELGQTDLDVLFLIKGKAGFASKSKYCKKYIETKTIEDGLSYLKDHYKEEVYKPIVIIASDDIVTFVDERRDELCDRYILPLTSRKGDTKKYTDKFTMTKLAQEIGILCPTSHSIQRKTSIENVQYPCVVKPSHQKPGHYNEFKFKICNSEKELARVMRFTRKDSEFILQQYIPKEMDLLIYGGRMRDGRTIIAGAMLRDRLADSGSFSHGYITADIPTSADINRAVAFLERIDYYGLFSFEYGMIRDNAYFFEVNLRNDGTSHYFFQAGANIPLAYVYSCAGFDYSQIQTKVQSKSFFIDEVFDIENVIKKKITKQQWKDDMENATVFKYYDENDQTPWLIVKKNRYKQMLQDFILWKYRPFIVYVLDKVGLKK